MDKTLPEDSQDATETMRDEFGMASAILQYAIRENIAGFTLSGLKIPRILQTWARELPLPPCESFALEVSIFQEHLADRIAALAHNRKILREIWRFNEISRDYRESELLVPGVARDILDRLADLVNALFAQDEKAALAAFDGCLVRRFSFPEQIDTLRRPVDIENE